MVHVPIFLHRIVYMIKSRKFGREMDQNEFVVLFLGYRRSFGVTWDNAIRDVATDRQ